MTLENKLGIIDSVELSKAEEKISKKKAIELFDKNIFDKLKPGSCEALFAIHKFLFEDIRLCRKAERCQYIKGKFQICTSHVPRGIA